MCVCVCACMDVRVYLKAYVRRGRPAQRSGKACRGLSNLAVIARPPSLDVADSALSDDYGMVHSYTWLYFHGEVLDGFGTVQYLGHATCV